MQCPGSLKGSTVAFGGSTLSWKCVYKWDKLFTKGWEDARHGCRSISTTDESVWGSEENCYAESSNHRIDGVPEDVGYRLQFFCDVLGMQRHGHCTTIMHQPILDQFFVLYWLKTTSQSYLSHHVYRTWSTCDFLLFPKLERPMKGRCFATITEIKIALLKQLKTVAKSWYQKR